MNITIEIPHYVLSVARVLLKEGYKAYLIGGAIRQTLLKQPISDYDIYTDALPESLLKLFPKAIAVGAKFGTVVVVQRDVTGEHFHVEVTTLRSEEEYVKGRWPSKVTFVNSLEKDLSRRDFTFNAMAVDLSEHGLDYLSMDDAEQPSLTELSSFSFTLIDYYGGINDIESKVVRTVGDPIKRFTEDGLRMYRACRFASQLSFVIEENTFLTMKECLPVAKLISAERIRDEFLKILYRSPKPSKGIEYLRISGLLEQFFPELLATRGVDQPIGHAFDVYEHTLRVVDIAPDAVKLAALFHDIAKPQTSTNDGHFYGHDKEGATIAETVMKRLRFSTKEIQKVSNLVRWHMFYYPYSENDLIEHPVENIAPENEIIKWNDGAVRRFIKRVGADNISDLFMLRIADGSSEPESMWDPKEIIALEKRISKILEEDAALKVTDLAIDGVELQSACALKPGPLIGKTLAYLLEQVIEDPKLNTKEKLTELAKQFISANQ